MRISALFLLACIVTGCSHTYDIGRGYYHLNDVNRWISGKDVLLIFQDGDSAVVHNLHLMVDSASWIQMKSNDLVIKPTSSIHKIVFVNYFNGFLEGFFFGTLFGAGTGSVAAMVGGGGVDAAGFEHPLIRFIVIGGSTVIVSTVIGTGKGSKEEYIINHKAIRKGYTMGE